MPRAAERFSVSVTTARRWADRYRELGKAGMVDRSSRPRQQSEPAAPANRAADRESAGDPAVGAGPDCLPPGPEPLHGPSGAGPVPVPAAEVDRSGHRHPDQDLLAGTAPLRAGRARRPGACRHQEARTDPRGRRLEGAGPRPEQEQPAARIARAAPVLAFPGYGYIHSCGRRPQPAGLLRDPHRRAQRDRRRVLDPSRCLVVGHGITVREVLTDNGNCYRSRLLAKTARRKVTHRFTRPYRPQTNGKVERFNRTMLEEWAYARPYAPKPNA